MRSSGAYASLVLVAATLTYGIFQARTLLEGPELRVLYPMPGDTVTDVLYTLRGTAHNISRVRVNGRSITTDIAGNFSEPMVTPNGYSVILIEAENRLGRYATQRIEILGLPHSPTATVASSTATATPALGEVEANEI